MTSNLNGPRVLVVDDEPAICRSCEKILSREGYAVTTVTSGADALRHLAEGTCDVVFTDLKMAELGGMELLGVLRSSTRHRARRHHRVRHHRLGRRNHEGRRVRVLPKPFTPAEMAAVAGKAWERRQQILRSRGITPASGQDPAIFAGLVGGSPKMLEVLAHPEGRPHFEHRPHRRRNGDRQGTRRTGRARIESPPP